MDQELVVLDVCQSFALNVDQIIDSNLNDAYMNQMTMNYKYSDEVDQSSLVFSSDFYMTQPDNYNSVAYANSSYTAFVDYNMVNSSLIVEEFVVLVE